MTTRPDLTTVAHRLADAIDAYDLGNRPLLTLLDGQTETIAREFPPAKIRAALNRVGHELRTHPTGNMDWRVLEALQARGLTVERRWAIHATPLAGMIRHAAWHYAEAYWADGAKRAEHLAEATAALDKLDAGAPYGLVNGRPGTVSEWLAGASR